MGKVKTGRDEICRKALELFLHKGYRETSLNDIAASLSVTKGALYHHFSNKQELYYQSLKIFFSENTPVIDYGEKGLRELLQDFFMGIYSRREELQKMAGSHDDHAIILLYSFLYEATREFPEFQTVMDRGDEERLKALSRLITRAAEQREIRQDLDPELTAFEIEVLMQQLIYLSFVNPRIKKDQDHLNRLFENYWKRFLP